MAPIVLIYLYNRPTPAFVEPMMTRSINFVSVLYKKYFILEKIQEARRTTRKVLIARITDLFGLILTHRSHKSKNITGWYSV